MKVVNIDEFLTETGVKIVLKGKEYVIKDIPLKVQEILSEEKPNTKKAVSLLLGIKEEDLEGYGVVALSKIIKVAYENLLKDVVSPSKASKD